MHTLIRRKIVMGSNHHGFVRAMWYQNIRFLQHLVEKHLSDPPLPELLDFANIAYVEENIALRQSKAAPQEIRRLLTELDSTGLNESRKSQLLQQLKKEVWKLPNDTHPDVRGIGPEPRLIQKYNVPPDCNAKAIAFPDISKRLNLLRMEHLGNFTGHKSYYFLGALAEMEYALLQYALDRLKEHKFNQISVPDILPAHVIEGCGMDTSGERTQVYKLAGNGMCLSGTSEMALAGYFSNKVLSNKKLPVKLIAISRCFRAETSGLQEEKGIYRVHQFSKAEMFTICTPQQSDEMLEQFKEFEINLFKDLGLHFRLLDMPPNELGAPAYRKYDIEAWMPGRNMWGEVSSCSNCTDYQAKRLNIRYEDNGDSYYVHTVNGTACAVPRMLIALIETNQRDGGTIAIPEVLQKYMRGKTEIKREKRLPELKLVKNIQSPG